MRSFVLPGVFWSRVARLVRLVAAFYLLQFRFYVRLLAAVRILPWPLAVALLRHIPPASVVLRARAGRGL